jgi:hypothetical protein
MDYPLEQIRPSTQQGLKNHKNMIRRNPSVQIRIREILSKPQAQHMRFNSDKLKMGLPQRNNVDLQIGKLPY